MEILPQKLIKKKCALDSTFSKGRSISNQDGIYNQVMFKSSENSISFEAEAEGSYSNAYEVFIEIENKQDEVQLKDYNCTCPAFEAYSGFCKHLAALALEINFQYEREEVWQFANEAKIGEVYENFEEEDIEFDLEQLTDFFAQKTLSDYLPSSPAATSSGRTFGVSRQSEKGAGSTSQELLDAISQMTLQERNQFCQETAGGDIDLETTLHLAADGEYLSLRIGKKQMYVVKNMHELLENIRSQNYVKYGKNLEFTHVQSAFCKEALPIVSLLLNTHIPSSYGRYYYDAYQRDKRYLQLDEKLLDQVMELFEGKELLVQSPYAYDKEKVWVKKEDPLLFVSIKGDNKRNRAIITFPEIMLLEGASHLFIFPKRGNVIYSCSDQFKQDMKEILKLMAENRLRAERKENSYYSGYMKGQRTLDLLEKDYISFTSTLLPVLEKYTDTTITGVDFTKYQMEEGQYELYFDLLQNHDVVCDAKAIYGEKEHNLIKPASLNESYRDIRTEYEIRALLSSYLPERTSNGQQFLLHQDDDRLAALVEGGIHQLKNLADVFASEAFKKVRISKPLNVTAGLSIKGNLLNVSWNVEGMSANELLDILSAYRHKKKYHRLKNGELLNVANSGIAALADLQDDLNLTKSQLKAGMADVPLYRALYMDTLMKENADRINGMRDQQFERLIENFEQLKDKKYELPVQIEAELRSYQMAGFRWACTLSEFGFGGILADDMGLGKTLQMIAYMCYAKGMTHLVVCPASLVYNWEEEFHKFAPECNVCLMIGTVAERSELIAHYLEYDVLVTSYDLLKRDIELYEGKQFGCQIIDEAQYIKNPSTQAAKAVKTITSKNRFALTGTPIENRLSELWSIFEYLMPGYLFSYKHFKETFEETIVQGAESKERHALTRLHKMIQPFLLRRLKKDVLKDLPDKIEEVIYSKFDSKQEALYKATEKNIIMSLNKKSDEEFRENKLQILAELTKLRQICCDPSLLYDNYSHNSAKLDTCMELVESGVEGGHKILLFSQFTSMLELLANELKKREISFLMLTGATSKGKRRDLVQKFQQGKADVFLISLKAGGTGLNLTAADLVIHYDPWWNVAAQNQATDRAHRIGQEKNVTVMKLIAKNTIEERILKLQEAKQNLADKIMSAEGISLSSLSKEELLGLFNF